VRHGGALVLALGAWAIGPSAEAQQGQIQCIVSENGTPARGSFVVEQGGRQVASGSCGKPLSAPPGPAKVTVRLEGALDNPARSVEVTVTEGKTTPARVDFETAVLEVRIETKEKRGTGIVAVEKSGRRIGTMASGVPARLSAGSYVVVVRLGGAEQRTEIDLRPGQRRLVRAQF
jgi:hypothetical protein